MDREEIPQCPIHPRSHSQFLQAVQGCGIEDRSKAIDLQERWSCVRSARNPGNSAVRLYSPAGRASKEYCPDSSVFASRRITFPCLAISIVAPATACPCGSLRVPETLPLLAAHTATDAAEIAMLATPVERKRKRTFLIRAAKPRRQRIVESPMHLKFLWFRSSRESSECRAPLLRVQIS